MKYGDSIKQGGFIPWQPSTWPETPSKYEGKFAETLGVIINKTMLCEIDNVICDAQKANGDLQHRGHVVALALLCAVDSIAAYAFDDRVGTRYTEFIATFFPDDYQPFAKKIYDHYRNSVVHSWNLFEVGISSGNEPISENGGSLSFGLINFFDALKVAVNNFLAALPEDSNLQTNSLIRYSELKNSATA